MKPKTWQISSYFQNFSNSVRASALYASIAFVFSFIFCSETDNLHIRTFKVTQEKVLTFEILSGDLRSHYLPSIYDTELFSSCKQ